jgi:hypothetical protein
MSTLPLAMTTVLGTLAPLFSRRTFEHAALWLVGAILAPGKRPVTTLWRVRGKSADAHVQHDHRILNRARWSALAASRMLLTLLLDAFVPEGPVVMGIDETSERWRGEKIAAKGIYRYPVRSSHTPFVTASGLRWVCLLGLAPIPWIDGIWALPLLTVLAPSERDDTTRGRRPRS